MDVQVIRIIVRPDRAVAITQELDEVAAIVSSDPSVIVLANGGSTPTRLDAKRLCLVQRPWVKDAELAALTTILCFANRQQDGEQLIAVAIVGESCFHDGRQFGSEVLLHQGRRLLPQWGGCKDDC